MKQSDPLLFSCDLWQSLAGETRDILLYGMGNGADKLLAVCEARGIPICGVFASDGFVRGHSFHGMRVMSYSEVAEKYPPGDCVVLLAFGSSRPEVMSLFDRVATRYPLYVPDLPVCGDTLFDQAFYAAHGAEFAAARALLANEESRVLFDRVLTCKYTARHACFAEAVSAYTPWDYLATHRITAMADLGAYNGDSAKEAIGQHPELQYLLAVEPDRRSFKKLQLWAGTVPDILIECHNVAVWDKHGEAAFDASGNRNAGLCTGRTNSTVATDTVDRLLDGRCVDYIKLDVEGAEAEALRGAAETIRSYRPALRVAAYHRPEDMFLLPHLLTELCPHYRLFLTRLPGFPAWDLDIVAIPELLK